MMKRAREAIVHELPPTTAGRLGPNGTLLLQLLKTTKHGQLQSAVNHALSVHGQALAAATADARANGTADGAAGGADAADETDADDADGDDGAADGLEAGEEDEEEEAEESIDDDDGGAAAEEAEEAAEAAAGAAGDG
jgi:hypothetical protein